MKPRLSVILHYNRKRNIKILNLCKISIHARNLARKIYKMCFYHNKLLDLKSGSTKKFEIERKKIHSERDNATFSSSYSRYNSKTYKYKSNYFKA